MVYIQMTCYRLAIACTVYSLQFHLYTSDSKVYLGLIALHVMLQLAAINLGTATEMHTRFSATVKSQKMEYRNLSKIRPWAMNLSGS